MYPLTLQAAIMRHMLNLARQLASGDLLESREKLEEYPLCGDPAVFDEIMRFRAVQSRMWGNKVDDTITIPGDGAPTSPTAPSVGCVIHINGRAKIPMSSTTP